MLSCLLHSCRFAGIDCAGIFAEKRMDVKAPEKSSACGGDAFICLPCGGEKCRMRGTSENETMMFNRSGMISGFVSAVRKACVLVACVPMLLFAWMEGEQVCLGPAELCWKRCGYVLCGGIRYGMLAFPLENHKWMLGALCEQLYRSCVPFQLFLYRGVSPEEKCIRLRHLACAGEEGVVYEIVKLD